MIQNQWNSFKNFIPRSFIPLIFCMKKRWSRPCTLIRAFLLYSNSLEFNDREKRKSRIPFLNQGRCYINLHDRIRSLSRITMLENRQANLIYNFTFDIRHHASLHALSLRRAMIKARDVCIATRSPPFFGILIFFWLFSFFRASCLGWN